MVKQALGRIKTLSKLVTPLRIDALDKLRADHMKAELMLIRLRLARGPQERRRLLSRLRSDVERHMRIEEESFYPACEEVAKLKALIENSREDHEVVRSILAELEAANPEIPRYNQLLMKLAIKLEGHVIQEENRVFPLVESEMSPPEFRRVNDEVLRAFKRGPEEPARRRAA